MQILDSHRKWLMYFVAIVSVLVIAFGACTTFYPTREMKANEAKACFMQFVKVSQASCEYYASFQQTREHKDIAKRVEQLEIARSMFQANIELASKINPPNFMSRAEIEKIEIAKKNYILSDSKMVDCINIIIECYKKDKQTPYESGVIKKLREESLSYFKIADTQVLEVFNKYKGDMS